jgi:hypothetical protein
MIQKLRLAMAQSDTKGSLASHLAHKVEITGSIYFPMAGRASTPSGPLASTMQLRQRHVA